MRARLAWELLTGRAHGAIDAAIVRRRAVPRGMDIDDAPALDVADVPYMEAYWQLHTCRAFGVSTGPIPWSVIVAYAMHRHYDPERTEALVTVVRAMDDAFLDYQETIAKEREAATTPSTDGKKRRAVRSGGGR